MKTYAKQSIAKQIAAKLTKKTGEEHAVIPVHVEGEAKGWAVKKAADVPPPAGKKKYQRAAKEGDAFVIRLTGPNMGRGRFLTEQLQLDPWKFHAKQFRTREAAELFASQLELTGPDSEATVEVVLFQKAWREKAA